MRLLFSCIPAYGHFHPMVPLARACLEGGHDVIFATGDDLGAWVRHQGFDAASVGPTHEQMLHLSLARHADLAALPRSDRWRFGSAMFGGVRPPAVLADLVPLMLSWRPDLVVHEELEFAGPIAAAGAAIPWVSHGLGPSPSPEFVTATACSVALVWENAGRPCPPERGVGFHLMVDICPPTLRPPWPSAWADRRASLPPEAGGGRIDGERSTWLAVLGEDRPAVYVTRGTVVNENRDVFDAIVQGLAGEPIDIIVTVGRNVDPAALGRQPANVRVERYVPQAQVLARSNVVVTHGGSGTLLGALAHGLPLLMLPMGPDQFVNAEHAAQAGLARCPSRRRYHLIGFSASSRRCRPTRPIASVHASFKRRSTRCRTPAMSSPPWSTWLRSDVHPLRRELFRLDTSRRMLPPRPRRRGQQ